MKKKNPFDRRFEAENKIGLLVAERESQRYKEVESICRYAERLIITITITFIG